MILEWTINKHGGSLQVTKVQRKSSRQSIMSTDIYFNNTAKKKVLVLLKSCALFPAIEMRAVLLRND